MANPFATLQSDDFLDAQQRSLPTGGAWPRARATRWSAFLSAIADVYAQVQARIADLTERESDPAQTVELLPDWETEYGLPDPCTPPAATLAQRQAALLAKIRSAPGGQDPAYFIAIAQALGLTVAGIDTFRPFVAGSPAGAPDYGPQWRFTWRLRVAGLPVRHFVAGSLAGERLQTVGDTSLQCRLADLAPAHTTYLVATS